MSRDGSDGNGDRMIPDQFKTERLSVCDWRPTLGEPSARERLEAELSAVLTPRVLEHLPPPLQLGDDANAVSAWVDARAAEGEVLLIERRDAGKLIGLMILAFDPDAEGRPKAHIGYLLAEAAWGQGIASELLNGLVSAMQAAGWMRLVGGVGKANPASARVLQKAGFVADPHMSDPSTDMYVLDIG